MEEKRRDPGTLPSTTTPTDSPASEPPPRRRASNSKRKSNMFTSSNSSSTPSKRMLTREKAMLASFSPVHNGPLTRARQAPSNIPSVKSELSNVTVGIEGEKTKEEEERTKAIRELEDKIEADFELIRSRDSNVHVVPNHSGWFTWEKVHSLEELSLPSFFNGKVEGRTSDVYMEIRNSIMKKFHSNPNERIELKELKELEVGDSEAKQEVMEFLDYWGLINFHPFPSVETADCDELGDKESLVNSLYRFRVDEASSVLVQKPRFVVQDITPPSGLFADPVAVTDELLKQEGPSVEYHCNSCSADCSRKRYHCPKQADFDLCTECFNEGKFGSDMSSSDFILMEPVEAVGVGSSGKWTDQENLLLLEALEIFKENWNEIAEHVATKTKAQCMLHFLQMPIEDAFFDQTENKDQITKDTTDDKSVAPEETEDKKIRVDEGVTMKEVTEPEGKVSQEEETNDVETEQKTPKLETVIDDICKDEAEVEIDENTALKALTEAFEDVGYPITSESSFTFADLGNPVMGLAAFLVRLAGSDIATASARASVKSLQSKSGLLLATRHCYILEDPPENNKDSIELKSADADGNNDKGHKEKIEKADDKEMQDTDLGKGNKDSVSEEKQSHSSTRKSDAIREKGSTTENSVKPASQEKSSVKEISSENIEASQETVKDASQPEASKDVEMKDVLQSEKDPQEEEEVQQTKEGTKNVLGTPIGSDSVPENGKNGENPDKEKDVCEGTKDKHNIEKLKRVAISALSAAAVKAKNLAKEEEDQIRQLSVSLIEKQLHKLETKLSIFNEAESVTMRVREQLERSRQRLYHERAQIIAARLGVPPQMSSKASLPTNRIATNFANVGPRPPMGMAFPRPPMPRPPPGGTLSFSVPGTFVAPTATMTGTIDPSQGSGNVSSG